jgi:sensor histidine kinase YesM
MKRVLQAVAYNSLLAAGIAVVLWVFQGMRGLGRLGMLFLWCMAFAHGVGTLVSVVLPPLAPHLPSGRGVKFWSALLALLAVLAVLGSALSALFITNVLPGVPFRFRDVFLDGVGISIVATLAIGIATAQISMAKGDLEHANRELRAREVEKELALQLATQARLSALESRVHPHFLFNALNSISSLIREDPERAERLLGQLAELLRSTLNRNSSRLVPLTEEMRITEDYLALESARFGERLRYTIDIPAACANVTVPPLSVQTLVENAVKYAVAPRREGGTIRVRAWETPDGAAVEIQDDGAGFDWSAVAPGHGIDLLQNRLSVLFGGRARLHLERTAERMTVRLEVPAEVAA